MTPEENNAHQQGQETKSGGNVDAGKGIPVKRRISEDTLNLFRILICLALFVPVIQLYFTIPSAISMWVADPFVPFVNMIYFVLVILGGIWLLRYTFRLSDEENRRLKEQ